MILQKAICVGTKKQLADFSYQSVHPLFDVEMVAGDTYEPQGFYYKSRFDTNVNISSDCYNVEIGNSIFYFMNIVSNNEPFGMELYFVQPAGMNQDAVIKICQIGANSPLKKLGFDLNTVARDSSNHIKLDKGAKEIIDNYMIPL